MDEGEDTSSVACGDTFETPHPSPAATPSKHLIRRLRRHLRDTSSVAYGDTFPSRGRLGKAWEGLGRLI